MFSKKILKPISRIVLSIITILGVLTLTGCSTHFGGVIHPKGLIAFQERQLLFDAVALMLIVVIPVIIMSLAFIVRYRKSHKTSDYKPNWGHSNMLEAIWWGIPCIIIIVLGIMTWKMTHKLSPYRKIDVPGKAMLIKTVALPWKWLFIYPQGFATVNYLEIPVNKQVQFWLTSDNVPMSAFFIPQLGSQIYTMAGMRTRLHLLPTSTGTMEGLNSQFNGNGFSAMDFTVKVVTQKQFNKWVAEKKQAPRKLMNKEYQQLRKPTIGNKPEYFSAVEKDLFKKIIASYKSYKGPQRTEFRPIHKKK